MTVSGKHDVVTMQVKEDLRNFQYFAVALDDGKLANNGEEARGILQNKPNTNEHGSVATRGVSKFRAGGALSAGNKITVTTSGWMVLGDSGYYIVGECIYDVTSGSIGTGDFDFPTAPYLPV